MGLPVSDQNDLRIHIRNIRIEHYQSRASHFQNYPEFPRPNPDYNLQMINQILRIHPLTA